MDYTKKTLGELLSSTNDIIKRNAVSILKQLQGSKKYNCIMCPMNRADKVDTYAGVCNDCAKAIEEAEE